MRKQISILLCLLIIFSSINIGCKQNLLTDNNKPRLEDDYYENINYKTLKKKEIPPEDPCWNYYYYLQKTANTQVNSILNDIVSSGDKNEEGSINRKISDLYSCAVDLDGRNKTGLGPLKDTINSIESAKNIQEYVETISKIAGETGEMSLLCYYISPDLKESNKNIVYIEIPDLILGKEYLENDIYKASWTEYKEYISKMFMLTGKDEKEAEKIAEDIFAFQKDLASVTMTMDEGQNPSNVYNKYTKEDLANLFTNINFERVLENMKVSKCNEFVVNEVNVEKKINEYLSEKNLELLKKFSEFIILNDYAEYLSVDIRNAKLDFNNSLNGVEERYSDDVLSNMLVQSLAGFDLGKIYVKEHFPEENKEAIEKMVKDIISVYKKRIDNLDWMCEKTKENAKKKLDNMTIKIGCPDEWSRYFENVDIIPKKDGGNLVSNILNCDKENNKRGLEKLDKPVNKKEWSMTPQTLNAYYNPSANEIVFPAAILQAPFYDKKADYETNLGGIGLIIAHEITHAFDNNGALYDEEGNFNQWWTKEDYENFNNLSKNIIEYYDQFEVLPGNKVNGKLTLSENIADLGAMSCITELAGEDKKGLEKLFKNYANIWAMKENEKYTLLKLNTDTHAPDKIRVNAVLSSNDKFYNVYNIKETDKMYISPEKRVGVW